jgi:hypothetical protein
MARLYSNENFPRPAVEELRRLGHDVLTTQDAGQAGQSVPDETVLVFAHTEKRAVLTLNRKHFIRLHDQQPEHSGIIVCTFEPDFASLARRVHAALETRGDLANQLIRVNRPG